MKLDKGSTIKDIIYFQVHRNIVSLYKKYFEITEDLRQDHEAFLLKLREKSANDLDLKSIDYFTEEKYDNIRKKILDSGNDSIREIEKALDFVQITLKEDE